jgi:hypothetical protein
VLRQLVERVDVPAAADDVIRVERRREGVDDLDDALAPALPPRCSSARAPT